MILFQTEPIELQHLRQPLDHPMAGGVVTFEGRIRARHNDLDVLFLEYEAYEMLAHAEMQRVLEEVRDQFDILTTTSIHRVGRVNPGELAVWVGVSAIHRNPAFLACSFMIDAIKHRLPIWKKEYYSNGKALWVSCHQSIL